MLSFGGDALCKQVGLGIFKGREKSDKRIWKGRSSC